MGFDNTWILEEWHMGGWLAGAASLYYYYTSITFR